MRRERRQRPVLRGLLLFVLGALVGANATYFVMTRDAGPRTAMPAGERIETPLPMQPATEADASANNSNPASPSTGPMLPPPAVRATGVGPTAVPASGDAATMTGEVLLLPVQGITAAQLQDTFTDARSGGRVHDAIDIMAPAGTPVLAADNGSIVKLFNSKLGGITLYEFDEKGDVAYYYAHLQSYAPNVTENMKVKKGDVIGYVGSTGNASPTAPHLHFAVMVLGPEKNWWKGVSINPFPLLGGEIKRATVDPAVTLHP